MQVFSSNYLLANSSLHSALAAAQDGPGTWPGYDLAAPSDSRPEDFSQQLGLMAAAVLGQVGAQVAVPLAGELGRQLAPYAQEIGTQVLYGASLAVQMLQRPFNALSSMVPNLGAEAAEVRLPIRRPHFVAPNVFWIDDLVTPTGKPATQADIRRGIEMLIDELRDNGHKLICMLEHHPNPSAVLATGALTQTLNERPDLLLLKDSLQSSNSVGNIFGLEDRDLFAVTSGLTFLAFSKIFDSDSWRLASRRNTLDHCIHALLSFLGVVADVSPKEYLAVLTARLRHPAVREFMVGPLEKVAGRDAQHRLLLDKMRADPSFPKHLKAFVRDICRSIVQAGETTADWHGPVTQLLDYPKAKDAEQLFFKIQGDIRESRWEKWIYKVAADYPDHTLLLKIGAAHAPVCERLSDLDAGGRHAEEL